MKNVLILGDSYSTFEGYIPKGYAVYYCPQGRVQGPSVTKMDVKETWWKRVIDQAGDTLLLNNSWSGSTIGYTGYNNTDCSKDSSFIYRFRELREKGFFKQNKVDTVFVFGGTNDSWSGAPLGEMQLSNWEEKDLYFVLPAICHLMSELKAELPNAQIYFLINTEINPAIGECIKKAAAHYKVDTIQLVDIEKEFGHPNANGMQSIAEQVVEKYLEEKE